MKNSFILFQSYKPYFEDLTGDEVKELMLAIFEYENTRVQPANLSTKVGCYFLVIKQQLDKNYEEYLKIAEKNRENISKRWNKPNTKDTSGINGMSGIPKILDNDIDNVVDNDIDIDIKKEKDKKEKEVPKAHPPKFQKPTKEEVIAYAKEKGLRTDITVDKWFNHYESNGWKVGKNPMRDWKASYRNWNLNSYDNSYDTPKNKGSGNPFKDRLQRLEEKEKVVDVQATEAI